MTTLSAPVALDLSGLDYVQHAEAQDVLHDWTTRSHVESVENWVDVVLDQQYEFGIVDTPIRRLGPVKLHRLRFWSGLWSVQTSMGKLWAKQCPPGQRFEADLIGWLSAQVDRHVPEIVDACPACGTILNHNLSDQLDSTCSPSDYALLGRQVALMQKDSQCVLDHITEANLHWTSTYDTIDFPLDKSTDYVQHAIDQLASLPAGHFQYLSSPEAKDLSRHVDRLAQRLQQLTDALDIVTVQPGDMHIGNVYRKNAVDAAKDPEAPFWLTDFGDAVNSHPFGVLHSMLWLATDSYPDNPSLDHPLARVIASPYLDEWGLDPDDAFASGLVDVGVRLGALHRFESWRRLVAGTATPSLVTRQPRLKHYLQCVLL